MQRRILILFSASFFFLNISAQDKYRAVHWGLDEGLSQGETYTLIKDVNGFLWIGTRYGLNRFDGNTFKAFLPQRNNKKSLISNRVIAGLIEDSLHNIWIGSEDKGASRYNIKTEDFTNFFPDSSNRTIAPFWATRNEVLCIEDNNITAYNIYTSQKKVLAHLNGYGTNNSFFDDRTNTVWCLSINPKGNAMLFQVNISDNRINFFPLPHHSASTYLDAEAMCFDLKRNCIWINGNEGLLRFTLNDKQFHHIDALSKYEHIKNYGRFVGITLDKKGRIWFATKPHGMIIYDPNDDSVNFPFPSDYAAQREIAEFNACLYCDRDGIIWSGFWLRKGIDGIFPFDPVVKHYPTSPKKDSLNGDIIVGAKDAGAGKIWVGARGGPFILDKGTGIFKPLPKEYLLGIKGDIIGAIAMDTLKQKAWLLANGVFRIDMSAKKNTPIIFKTLDNRITTNIGVPKLDGQQIFFTSADDSSTHICVLNLMNDTAHEILSFRGHPFNIFFTVPVENRFLFLQGNADEKNNRTYENKNGKWILTHTTIDSIGWHYLFFEKENNSYWVAGENKLFHFDKNFKLLKIYSKDDGLAELPLFGLTRDNVGNIWFHTDRSIQQLNVATGQIKTMSGADGFEKVNFEGLPFADKDADGNIYYGGGIYGSGLDKISPNKNASTVSTIYLKSLTINQKLFPLKESINFTDTLSLKYNETKIEIETGIIDFYSQGKSRIRYKLERNSLHEGWQYAPYYYTIRYEGLQPGDYRLVVQASNASNEFNGPEKILLIHISPPFWDTWWFRIVAAIFIIASIYGFIQYRSRNLRKRNIVLEEKVMSRTKELKHSLEDLRETQTQLIQREKMASLGELTAGIAHEIQNPLNFVNNFSEVNTELIEELLEEKKKEIRDFKIEDDILNDIKENEQKINHHGKRADAIVKGMLQHSRSSSGIKEPTDINALTDEYLRLSYHGLRAKDKSFNAKFETDFEPAIGKINIVSQDIGRVILNLINNAFYAVNEKGKQNITGYEPIVIVSTRKVKDKVEIRVKDNGNGIPQKVLDKIFQPFFTTKPTGQGTGLGLSISYDIVKALGGELNVETKETEYSEFIISLPT